LANLKFQDATARVPTGADIIPFVKDPAGTPLDGKATIADIVGAVSSTQVIAWAYEDAPNAGALEYVIPFGGAFSATTVRNWVAGRAGTLKKMTIATNSAGNTNTVTATIQLEGADTALTVGIPTTTSNAEMDVEEDVTFAADDRIRIKFDSVGSTGMLRIASISLEVLWD